MLADRKVPQLTQEQAAIVEASSRGRAFVHGPAGAGKSTVGLHRMLRLLQDGVPGSSILVLAPQRTLLDPYLAASRTQHVCRGSDVDTATIGGLARRLCDLYWPLVAEQAGFARPEMPPYFLNLESAQYYMAEVVRPLAELGHFQTLTIDRARLYAQILDSLNKSAAIGFPHTEIGARLASAWSGDTTQLTVYSEAQDCASRFRDFCLKNGLLDFSLQLEILWKFLWPNDLVREHLHRSYRHLIYDNVEEDIPRAHDVVREWLPEFESGMLIYDQAAGFRRFLGADPDSGWRLGVGCDRRIELRETFVMSDGIEALARSLSAAIQPLNASSAKGGAPSGEDGSRSTSARLIATRFYPEMLDMVASAVQRLVDHEGVRPAAIVVLAPYLSDALRFALGKRLDAHSIPHRSHRPSRSLRDEPAARCLLTLAAIAHPGWAHSPAGFDVTLAFMKALNMDLVRARLLQEIVYRRGLTLSPFDEIGGDARERITPAHGDHYARLREWILSYREGRPLALDHFLRKLFGEILSQPGYGFHSSLDDARVAGSLVESVRKFRFLMERSAAGHDHHDFDTGREYLQLLADGLLAAQYLESWSATDDQAVLLAPAHSFMMMNRPAEFQFWLDPGSSGWFEHIDQPLTHSGVLTRNWPMDQKWTLAEEERQNTKGLIRLVTGLLRRCRRAVYFCSSQLNESGFEQRGRLHLALNQVVLENYNDPS